MLQFQDQTTRQHITLTDQLTLSGTARRDGTPIAGALVALSEATGEVVNSARTDDAGRYACRYPRPAGTS